jgi:hypothetical protein
MNLSWFWLINCNKWKIIVKHISSLILTFILYIRKVWGYHLDNKSEAVIQRRTDNTLAKQKCGFYGVKLYYIML